MGSRSRGGSRRPRSLGDALGGIVEKAVEEVRARRCPKCGLGNLTRRFVAAPSAEEECAQTRGCYDHGEHLHVRCPECGWWHSISPRDKESA